MGAFSKYLGCVKASGNFRYNKAPIFFTRQHVMAPGSILTEDLWVAYLAAQIVKEVVIYFRSTLDRTEINHWYSGLQFNCQKMQPQVTCNARLP
jgi:hypothetical protein